MGSYVALSLINKMKKKKIQIKRSKILVMGLTFKENCADIRNSGVRNVVSKLENINAILIFMILVDEKKIKIIYKKTLFQN